MGGCGGSRETKTVQAPSEATPSAEVTGSHSGHGSGAAVEMRLIQFTPEQVDVEAGKQVTWTQTDAGFHTVTSGTVEPTGGGVTVKPDGRIRSEKLATDQTFKFTFGEPGTYPYFCEIHPATMTGEVSVGA